MFYNKFENKKKSLVLHYVYKQIQKNLYIRTTSSTTRLIRYSITSGEIKLNPGFQ